MIDSKTIHNSNIAIYGAGNTGKLVLKALEKLEFSPVCFIDKNQFGRNISNIEIIDTKNIEEKNIDIIILGIFSYPRECNINDIINYLKSSGVKKVVTFEEFYQSFPDIFAEPIFWLTNIEHFRRQKDKIAIARKLFTEKKSLNIFDSQIKHRLGEKYSILPEADFDEIQYLPKDLNIIDSELNFIDIGAYNGDTIIQFHNAKVKFNKIVAFEPDMENFKYLSDALQNKNIAREITLMPVGAGKENNLLLFNDNIDSSSKFSENGNKALPVVKIDNILKGFNPTYIKMDVEGFESDVLKGLYNTIKEYKPNLAISAYHLPDNLYSIVIYLNEITDCYNFYLRMHGSHCFDTVLYAIKNKGKS